MSADISSALDQIEAGVRRLGRSTLDFLNPGIQRDEAIGLLSPRSLDAPDDLLDLWGWRNGTDGPAHAKLGELWLVPGFYLLSAEQAAADFDAFRADARWNSSWLPVFADGGGDFLAVDCAAAGERGAVHHFRIDESVHPVEYLSVERMLATFAAAFSRGAFYVDAEGWLEEDAEELRFDRG